MMRFGHMVRRRRQLQQELPVWRDFAAWEETCVPSYCHPNWLASYAGWSRLFAAVDMARHAGVSGSVLDFGASTGELGRLLPENCDYHFIEQEEPAAACLLRGLPGATRHTLDTAPEAGYQAVFALDSLEHNDNFPDLIDQLTGKLRRNGVFVLSGPTENALYRLGRRIAGFDAHYHVSNIDRIESSMARRMRRTDFRRVPFGLPLFKLSVWSHRL